VYLLKVSASVTILPCLTLNTSLRHQLHESDIHSTSGNIHTNGAHNINNDNNTTPMFIGLHKTTQKHGPHKSKISQGNFKSYIHKQIYFNVNHKME
jgi:hypothetical protein